MLTTTDRITLHRLEVSRDLDCEARFAGCEAEDATLLGLAWLVDLIDEKGLGPLDVEATPEWLEDWAIEDAAIDGPRAIDEAALPAMLDHLAALAAEVSDAA